MAKDKCRELKGGKSLAVSKFVNVDVVDLSIAKDLEDSSFIQETYKDFLIVAEELEKVNGSSFKKYSM